MNKDKAATAADVRFYAFITIASCWSAVSFIPDMPGIANVMMWVWLIVAVLSALDEVRRAAKAAKEEAKK